MHWAWPETKDVRFEHNRDMPLQTRMSLSTCRIKDQVLLCQVLHVHIHLHAHPSCIWMAMDTTGAVKFITKEVLSSY